MFRMLQEEHQERCVYNASDYFHYCCIQLVDIKFIVKNIFLT